MQFFHILRSPRWAWSENAQHIAEYLTVLDITLFLTGCLLWVAVYVVIVRNVFRYHFVEMPAVIGASNLSWEFIWSWIYYTVMGHLFTIAYRMWFFVDVFIFASLLKYGWKQGFPPQVIRVFKPMMFFALFATGALWYSYVAGGHNDHGIGNITAYAGNLFISALYLFQLARMKDVRALSPAISWLKMLGTGLITVFMYRVFVMSPRPCEPLPDGVNASAPCEGLVVNAQHLAANPTGYLEAAPDYFVLWMGLICLALDIYYIVRLRARRAEQAAGIPGVPALDEPGPIGNPAYHLHDQPPTPQGMQR